MYIKSTPQTLTRAGRFDNPLEEAVKGFTEPLELITFGLGNTVKYAVFKEAEEPYLLMVSQQKDRLTTPAGYNVLLTITSYSDKKNKQVAEQFENETRIPLNIAVPEWMKEQNQIINLSFQVFAKNPRAAMAVLKG